MSGRAGDPLNRKRLRDARNFLLDGQVFRAHALATEGLQFDPNHAALRAVLALSFARTGAVDAARDELLTLQSDQFDKPLSDLATAELDLLTEVHLEAWRQSGSLADLAEAQKSAVRLADHRRNPWAKIRAAVTMALQGKHDDARRWCRKISQSSLPKDEFQTVRIGYLQALIDGAGESAVERAKTLTRIAGNNYARIVPFARLTRELERSGLMVPEAVHTAFAPPKIVVFTGHDLDRPGDQGSIFPAQAQTAVAKAIKAALDQLDPRIGYAMVSAGSNLLFCKAMLARGAELHLILPCAIEDVRAQCVAYAGDSWLSMFDDVVKRATSIDYATTGPLLGHTQLFRFGNQMLHGLATLRAQFLETDPYLLALWDYNEDSLIGGAADFIDQWGDIARLRIIDLADVTGVEPVMSPANPALDGHPVEPDEGFQRQVKVMLFADIMHFSKLGDEHMPQFLSLMEEVAGQLHAQTDLAFIESWGDALFIVMDEAHQLTGVALALSRLFGAAAKAADLPVTLQIRISLDAGPVYQATDPFTGRTNYWGFHINRAARLEPVTVPGQVYATQPFVALLASEESVKKSEAIQAGQSFRSNFVTAYVGRLALAKGFGEEAVYHLRFAHAHEVGSVADDQHKRALAPRREPPVTDVIH